MKIDSETWAVSAALVAVTGMMLIYVRIYLRARIDERMRESMKAFSTAIELRFPSHEGLSVRVVNLGLALGKRLRLTKSQLRNVEMAGRLREIGLCSIPYRLINDKPIWQWTSADRATYDRFPEVSAAMLDLVPSVSHLAPIVRCHLAAFDGSDGPTVPMREDLPIESRLLKVCSDFVWSEKRQGTLMAKETLKQGAGTLYDPDLVRTFLSMVSINEPTRPPVEEPAPPTRFEEMFEARMNN